MFKQLTLIVFMASVLLSCNSKKADKASDDKIAEATGSVYTFEKLMDVVDTQVGKEVKVRGHVTHVCKHAGKKCFITGDTGKGSMQIMAKGDITAFNQELIGSEIEVTGTVMEHRMQKTDIDGREEAANTKMKEDTGAMEQCEAVLSNVKEMREWMEKNNKDYFAIYYVDGMNYEVVD